jgi:hypothetical protein
MSYEEEDRGAALTLLRLEEEDTCHMRRRTGEQPSLSSGLRRRIHVLSSGSCDTPWLNRRLYRIIEHE